MSERPGYVYLMRLHESPNPLLCPHKIGRTSDLSQRHKMLGIKMPYPVTLVAAIETTDMHEVERFLHETLQTNRLHGEWFRLEEWQIRTFCGMCLQAEPGEHEELIDALVSGDMDWDRFTALCDALAPLMRGVVADDDLPF